MFSQQSLAFVDHAFVRTERSTIGTPKLTVYLWRSSQANEIVCFQDLLPEAVPAFGEARVVDSYVQRYYGAVTWFSPGSFGSRPPLETSITNLVCAGDWVRMGEREHGAKGLCQVL